MKGERSNDLTPKRTRYGGVKMRSRLEARWAIFFDTWGVDWHYEPALCSLGHAHPYALKRLQDQFGGVNLDAVRYMPDFYIPAWDAYVEIKPVAATNLELAKAVSIAVLTGKYAVVIEGRPTLAEHMVRLIYTTNAEAEGWDRGTGIVWYDIYGKLATCSTGRHLWITEDISGRLDGRDSECDASCPGDRDSFHERLTTALSEGAYRKFPEEWRDA